MTRRRVWIGCLIAGGLCASVLLGEQGIVKTKDGNTLQGDVKEKEDSVVVTIHGVDTVIPKSEVASVEMTGSTAAELLGRLAKLDPKDSAGRVALARVAFDRREYELSRQFLEEALQIDPNNADASSLLDLVQNQIRMEKGRATTPPQIPHPVPPAPPGGPRATGPQPTADRRLLTNADIEAIRRKELRPGDSGVRVRFDGDVKKRFADSRNMPFADFNAKSQVEQAIDILDHGDDSMKDKVHVSNDPQSIREFRTQIQPLIIQNCALSGCHGGPPGGGLVLLNPADTDAAAYTNFYILQTYSHKVDGGNAGGGGPVFGGTRQRLIDRGRGEQSLLADYGLPATISESDHPLVNSKAITPVFRNKDDAKYRQLVDWMNNSLAQIDPDYGIHYTPPGVAATTTTTQASAPATQPRDDTGRAATRPVISRPPPAPPAR